MDTIKKENVVPHVIKESNKSVYKISQEYGSNISHYVKVDIRLSTLLKLCRICGFALVLVGKGKQMQIMEGKKCEK